MTNPGTILHADHAGTHYLRLIGDIRYPLAPSFDQFLQNIFATTKPQEFIVDLAATDAIDSTNLGLLVKLARFMGKQPVVLFSPREDINQILISMGFDQFFRLVTYLPEASTQNAVQIPLTETNPTELGQTILEAHRALIEMDARNELAFRDIVRYLEQEITS